MKENEHMVSLISGERLSENPQINVVSNGKLYYVTLGNVASEVENRKKLWEGLSLIANDNLSWLVMKDFNCIVDPLESMDCKPHKGLEDFRNWIANCHVEDVGYIGFIYTWTTGRKFKRLDMVLLNPGCVDRFSSVNVRRLARTGSDHTPLKVDCGRFSEKPKSSFRVQNMWILHEGFMQIVVED
ncbi:hypothetical protein LIER_09945 [Lithospermum erythrorhizon]|uniref:Uncharacterized protein n=1 Tax=Lithospermum erythrorhizon TaxID=34254 RepID=A0AAV3PHN5_LITER